MAPPKPELCGNLERLVMADSGRIRFMERIPFLPVQRARHGAISIY
jgi:hypothetical protein